MDNNLELQELQELQELEELERLEAEEASSTSEKNSDSSYLTGAIPFVGGALGGVVGSGAGPAGAIAGSGVGYAVGGQIRDAIREYILGQKILEKNAQKKNPVQEAVKDVASDVGSGALMGGTGVIAGKALQVGSRLNPVRDLFKAGPKPSAPTTAPTQAPKMSGDEIFKVARRTNNPTVNKTPQPAQPMSGDQIFPVRKYKADIGNTNGEGVPNRQSAIENFIKNKSSNQGVSKEASGYYKDLNSFPEEEVFPIQDIFGPLKK